MNLGIKGYGFLSFAKNFGIHTSKVAKNMNNKYSQKLLDSAKKSATDAIKTTSKRAIQKTAEATGDLIYNNKYKNAANKLRSEIDENEIEIPKEGYISSEKRVQIIDELELV